MATPGAWVAERTWSGIFQMLFKAYPPMGMGVGGDCPLRMKLAAVFCACAQISLAETFEVVTQAADASFANLPVVMDVADVSSRCQGDAGSNPLVRYCTSEDTIFFDSARVRPRAQAYLLAHVFGHAVQVKHGVADVALALIRANRDQETELRGMVTRQVECIAGVLLARAGLLRPDLSALFSAEPFTGSHWGRTPMSGGPKVSIGLLARQEWLDRGYGAGNPSVCGVGEMSAELLIAADQKN